MSLDVSLELDVDVGNVEPETIRFYSANITHNLGKMAKEAGIYQYLWRPEEIPVLVASELIEPLEKGLILLKFDPVRFKVFDSPNGWGMYEDFVPFVEKYLEACKRYPGTLVRADR